MVVDRGAFARLKNIRWDMRHMLRVKSRSFQ